LLKRLFKKRIKEVYDQFDEKDIIMDLYKANFFGLESWGMKQVRGNGVLILTENELFFGMLKPAKDISIQLNSIIKIKTSDKSHLRKANYMRLLKITFQNEGKEDTAAWLVTKLDDWEAAIRKLTSLWEDSND